MTSNKIFWDFCDTFSQVVLTAATSFGIPCLSFEPKISKIRMGITVSIDATFTTTKSSCFGLPHMQK
ncbi:hypothetical protein AXK27_07760 [Streptococcus pyogenes]|nr:hypothetical protein MGAS10750_Spy1751 [Streptococcus pyogenes MGAS10750]AMA69513.1 hypothetical protein AWM58_07820 [Streptococcus pyogenes]EPZ48713.1 hypothetical protein HMPREF1229_1550 [Streptococcus pyogenes GA40634]OAF87075.1 hypothetical protein AXK27_07760 [Streptococcus pyogenes]